MNFAKKTMEDAHRDTEISGTRITAEDTVEVDLTPEEDVFKEVRVEQTGSATIVENLGTSSETAERALKREPENRYRISNSQKTRKTT